MATVIDSFTVSSSSNIQMSLCSSSPLPRLLSPPISVVLHRSSLPHFSGLKIQHSSNPILISNLTNSRRRNKFSGRGGAIVCEASDTAVDDKLCDYSSTIFVMKMESMRFVGDEFSWSNSLDTNCPQEVSKLQKYHRQVLTFGRQTSQTSTRPVKDMMSQWSRTRALFLSRMLFQELLSRSRRWLQIITNKNNSLATPAIGSLLECRQAGVINVHWNGMEGHVSCCPQFE